MLHISHDFQHRKKIPYKTVLAMVVTISITFFINSDITDKVVVDDLVVLFIIPNNITVD
jgi:hypothetical protein